MAALDFDFAKQPTNAQYQTIVMPYVNANRNQFSNSAVSAGILNLDVGVGSTFLTLPSAIAKLSKEFLVGGEKTATQVAIPRLNLQQGLPFDFDIGVNLGLIPGSKLKTLGGGLQWTPFNPKGYLPSLALRLGAASWLGEPRLKAQTYNAEILTSVAVPPVVTLLEPFAGIGCSRSSARSEFNSVLWNERYFIVGARFAVLPPYLSISAEAQIGSMISFYSSKISLRF